MARGRKHGKPPAFDDTQLQLLELGAGYGLSLEELAALFDRSYRSLYDYIQKHKHVKRAIARGRAKANQKVAQTAYRMATSGDFPTMTQFWLKTRAGWKEERVDVDAGDELEKSAELDALVQSIAKVLDNCRDVTPVEPLLLDAQK